ncbi:MAG: acyloxyacyl hydrolase [Cytophagales bacterium]|nr:acyloxyacyl hydrolase [Cytophagales bacterium]
MHIHKHIFYIIVQFTPFISQYIYAQDAKIKKYSVGIDYYCAGRMMRFNRAYEMSEFLPENIYMIEASAKYHTHGSRPWHKYYGYPNVGISMGYINFIKKDIGYAIMLNPFIEFFLYRGRMYELTFTPSFGLAYNSKYWDRATNDAYSATSTPVTSSIYFTLSNNFKITDAWSIQAKFTFRHFSNGSIGIPNNGLNFINIGFGASYTISQNTPVTYLTKSDTLPKKYNMNVEIAMGYKAIKEAEVAKYLILNPSIYVSRYISHISNLMIGADLLYDESFVGEYPLKLKYNKDPAEVINWALAATVGHELKIGRYSYLTQVAYYMYKQDYFYERWYHRHTSKVMINKHLYIKASLKVYIGAADFFDYGVGWRW